MTDRVGVRLAWAAIALVGAGALAGCESERTSDAKAWWGRPHANSLVHDDVRRQREMDRAEGVPFPPSDDSPRDD